MRALLLSSLVAVGMVACAATPDDSVTTDRSLTEAASCEGLGTAGKLTLYFIPPPLPLDWSTPNRLIGTAIAAEAAGAASVQLGLTKLPHAIGHAHIQLDCGDLSIPLTGQTGGSEEWQSALDGFGMLLRDFDGSMDAMGSHAREVAEDIALRTQTGLVSRVSFLVNRPMCERIKGFHDEYVRRGAFKHYGGAFRARRFEGAGCGIFAANIVDVAGLLRRSQFTPPWVQSHIVGSARFANLLGGNHYPFGSNLSVPGITWPRGVDIPARQTPIVPGDHVFDAWSGPEDEPFAGLSLAAPMTSAVPFSIYDPEKMTDWAESVYRDARAHGTASSLEATWTATRVGASHEITTDAHCKLPQTIPFESDKDDLFSDSE